MKKIHLIFTIGSIIVCASCGPSAVEREAQRIADSSMMGDSLARVQAEQQRLAEIAPTENPTLANNISLNTKTPVDKKLIKTAELKFKVGNVWNSTEKIEDLTYKYGGYITYSNLQNRYDNYSKSSITRDSILITREIIVENEMKLRIPNLRLDSFIRELTPLVKYLDYRIIKTDDITFQFASIDKQGERFKSYEKRQTSHIDSKDSKLKDASAAENNLLERQLQADEIALKAKELADKLKYCDMSIEIYQKAIITKETIADFKYISSSKPNFFIRLIDSIIQGYWILEEFILFLFKIWSIILIGIAVFLGIRLLKKITNKK
jgi:hypothetical protein